MDLETNTKYLEPGAFGVHGQSSFIIPPCTEIIVPGELDSSCVVASTALLQPRPELLERYQIMGATLLVKVSNIKNRVYVRGHKYVFGPNQTQIHMKK